MGTAGSSRGPGSNTSLVPTWLDNPPDGPLPAGDDGGPAGRNGSDPADADPAALGGANDPVSRPAIVPPPIAARYQSARTNFSRFVGSGGSDRPALRRAVRDYVRSSSRGSTNAVRRMGASRTTARRALGVFRGFQRDGVAETLRRLNLVALIGRSTREVFIGLTDVICRDGGSIDEGIARDAWLETVADLESFGIGDLDALTPGQVQDVFLSFIAHAIETKLFQEIGVNGFRVAADLDAIETFEAQFKSYIERSVRDSFASNFSQLAALSDQEIRTVVERTYRDAWELLVLWGDQQG